MRVSGLLAVFLTFSTVLQASEMSFSSHALDGAQCLDACPVLAATGEVTDETVENFLQAITEGTRVLLLNSDGGDFRSGLTFGRAIRDAEIDVSVGSIEDGALREGSCRAACAFAFLGGRVRPVTTLVEGVELDGRLVFDKPDSSEVLRALLDREFTGSDLLQDQVLAGLLVDYLVDMGVSAELYARLSMLAPGQSYSPSRQELFTLSIVTDTGSLSWRIKNHKLGLLVELRETARNPSVRIYCVGAEQTWKVNLAFDDLRHDVASDSHQVCIGRRCFSKPELEVPNRRYWLTTDTGDFDLVFTGMYSDPLELKNALLDFQSSEAAIRAIEGSQHLAIGTENASVERELLSSTITPDKNVQKFNLVKRNCL